MSILSPAGLNRFKDLQNDATKTVTDRFYATHGSVYEQFGPRGRAACLEDLAFHLEFLRPVLEFGLLQPMVDYLCWLDSVLIARGIPTGHLALSIDWLADFFAEKMAGDEGGVVANALQCARIEFQNANKAPPVVLQAPDAWPETDAFETALLAGRQRDALAIVNRSIDDGHPLIDVELHVIQPALYHIGEKWQANQVSVAQEHLATSIVQTVMTVGLLRMEPPPLINKRVLLACVEGNNHSVGLRMVADAFQLTGWDLQYLGANVPTKALIQQTAQWKPDIVALSASFPQHLKVVKTITEQLDERFGPTRPAVLVGGLAINRFNRLASALGADAYSTDAHTAVINANQILMDK